MSKTYRDKRRYLAKHYYYRVQPPMYEWVGPFGLFLGEPKKDLNEPVWRSLYRFNYHGKPNHNNTEKYWFRWSKRKHRRLVKKLIKQERYGEIPPKPINVDWCIT